MTLALLATASRTHMREKPRLSRLDRVGQQRPCADPRLISGPLEGTHVMAAYYDESHHLVISEDDVRGGVTGHNVRYVLALSMTGVIVAFAAIAVYFGFDALSARLHAAFARHPSEIIQSLAPYAAIIFASAIVGGLLLGIWNIVAGRSEDDSESFMRARVVTQFAIICAIMAMLYISTA